MVQSLVPRWGLELLEVMLAEVLEVMLEVVLDLVLDLVLEVMLVEGGYQRGNSRGKMKDCGSNYCSTTRRLPQGLWNKRDRWGWADLQQCTNFSDKQSCHCLGNVDYTIRSYSEGL